MKKLITRLFLAAILLWQSVLPALGQEPFTTGPIPQAGSQAPFTTGPIAPVGPQTPTAPAAEARQVHLVLTGFAADFDIGPNCRQDLLAMEAQFTNAFAQFGANRLQVHRLYGEEWTAVKVLDYLRSMPTGPNDVVVFYQSGHGEIRNPSQPQTSLVFQVSSREWVSRGDVLQALRQRPSRGLILLTDCCSSVRPGFQRGLDGGLADRSVISLNAETVRSLFLRFRGIVDITAAEVGVAASATNNLNNFGGACSAFTVAFLAVSAENQTYRSWNEFYQALRARTQISSGGQHRAYAFQIEENNAPAPVASAEVRR